MALYNIGDYIQFNYPAVHLEGTEANDPRPRVLVLHNNWGGLVHGLNFNYLNDDEINMIRMILDPNFEDKYRANMEKKNPNMIRQYDSMMATGGGAKITSPLDFYHRVVQPFIRGKGWDPYRKYKPNLMRGTRVLQKRQILEGLNKPSAFHDYERRFRYMRGPRFK